MRVVCRARAGGGGGDALARRALERAWAVPRMRGKDLRAAIHREWGRPLDVNMHVIEGHVHLILHVCAPSPEDQGAYARKLGSIARRIQSWNAAGLVRERMLGAGSAADEVECNVDASSNDEEDEQEEDVVVLAIPLDVVQSRADEFDVVFD